MLKVLVLAAQNNVADARMEYLIRDRLSSPEKVLAIPSMAWRFQAAIIV
jgi:hypothetical protein